MDLARRQEVSDAELPRVALLRCIALEERAAILAAPRVAAMPVGVRIRNR